MELGRIYKFKLKILALHVGELPKEFKDRYKNHICVFQRSPWRNVANVWPYRNLSHLTFYFVPGN